MMKLLINPILQLISFLGILFFVFRDLVINITTNLIDWRDYPLMIWIMSQSVLKFQNLTFINFFDVNTFFPNKYGLLFSDLLLPQAIISLPLFAFSNNLVLIFNLVFIFTFILNFISSYFFWKLLFKNDLVAFFGSLLVIFSPFFHLTLDHFQMLSYWPFFFSLYYLIKYEESPRIKNIFLSGFFLAIQFLASVYLAIFLFFSIGVYLLLNLIITKNINGFLKISFVLFITFSLIDGVFIKGYIDVKNYYNISRKTSEYINYSAHLTDYIFTSRINSTLHKSTVMDQWNKANKNFMIGHASFPGFLLAILALSSLFYFMKNKENFITTIEIDRMKGFFVILCLSGLFFSLGPRLNFNGNYTGIPLPYWLFLKTAPFLESIRSPSRWSFIFYLGIIYLALISFKKIVNKKYSKVYVPIILLFFILEYIPINLKTEKSNLEIANLNLLILNCKTDPKVLLELPLTHLHAASNVAEGLTYINKVQLNSIYHGCYLINGYSGYDLPENFILADILNKYIQDQNTDGFIKELRKRKVNLVKFNQKYFTKELKSDVNIFLENIATESGVRKVGSDLFSLSSNK